MIDILGNNLESFPLNLLWGGKSSRDFVRDVS